MLALGGIIQPALRLFERPHSWRPLSLRNSNYQDSIAAPVLGMAQETEARRLTDLVCGRSIPGPVLGVFC
jgi:hypothetical protein